MNSRTFRALFISLTDESPRAFYGDAPLQDDIIIWGEKVLTPMVPECEMLPPDIIIDAISREFLGLTFHLVSHAPSYPFKGEVVHIEEIKSDASRLKYANAFRRDAVPYGSHMEITWAKGTGPEVWPASLTEDLWFSSEDGSDTLVLCVDDFDYLLNTFNLRMPSQFKMPIFEPIVRISHGHRQYVLHQ